MHLQFIDNNPLSPVPRSFQSFTTTPFYGPEIRPLLPETISQIPHWFFPTLTIPQNLPLQQMRHQIIILRNENKQNRHENRSIRLHFLIQKHINNRVTNRVTKVKVQKYPAQPVRAKSLLKKFQLKNPRINYFYCFVNGVRDETDYVNNDYVVHGLAENLHGIFF